MSKKISLFNLMLASFLIYNTNLIGICNYILFRVHVHVKTNFNSLPVLFGFLVVFCRELNVDSNGTIIFNFSYVYICRPGENFNAF